MVAGFGKRYVIYFPDGDVRHQTFFRPAKEPGETIKLGGRKWEVARAVELQGEETDWELHVEAADE